MVGFNLLPGLTFVTAEGVWWLMQHVEGVNKESIAVSLLQVKKSHNYNSCLALDLFLLLNSYKNLTEFVNRFGKQVQKINLCVKSVYMGLVG